MAWRAWVCCALDMVSILMMWLVPVRLPALAGSKDARPVTGTLWILVTAVRAWTFCILVRLKFLLMLTFTVLLLVMFVMTVFCWTRVRGGRGISPLVRPA